MFLNNLKSKFHFKINPINQNWRLIMKKIIRSGDFFASVSSKGGSVADFAWKGIPIIYPERAVGEKSRGGIPICFPFFGKSVKNFSELPRHGWLRNEELELLEESEAHVVFGGKNKPLKHYPWVFEYRVSVFVDSKNGLQLIFGARRLSDGQFFPAPINPAFHPYFNNFGSQIVVTGKESISKFGKEAKKIKPASSVFLYSGRWITEMKLGGDFNESSCLVLWSDSPDEYFCVEPVLACPELLEKPIEMRALDIGEQVEIECIFRPI